MTGRRSSQIATMPREARHVHYDDDAVKAKKPHKGSHHRRQRRRRRVSRRAKIYGAAFLLALTGFFCLVPGTSLTVVAFTNRTNSKESILRLVGPVFAGVGFTLLGISMGLVFYAMILKHRARKTKDQHRHRNAADSIITRDGDKAAAEVRLLDADDDDAGTVKVKHELLPNLGRHQGMIGRGVGACGDPVPASTVTVDIMQPPPPVTVKTTANRVSAEVGQAEPQATNESFQSTDEIVNASPDVDLIVPGDVMTNDKQQGEPTSDII